MKILKTYYLGTFCNNSSAFNLASVRALLSCSVPVSLEDISSICFRGSEQDLTKDENLIYNFLLHALYKLIL